MKASFQLSWFYLLLFCIAVFTSNCKKEDEQPPTITIVSPTEAASFEADQTLNLRVTIVDDNQLSSYKVLVRNLITNELAHIISESTTDRSVEINETITLEVAEATNFAVEVETEDQSGNVATKNSQFELLPPSGGVLSLNFKLEYQDTPLVMFEEKAYPGDYTINFTRFSFFISDVTLIGADGSETNVLDIDMLNLTEAHEQSATAENGFDYPIPGLATGDFTAIRFGIGVPPDQNSQRPNDFPTGHPLSVLSGGGAEHWTGWNSYVFFKLEGNIDTTGHGDYAGIALHAGADDAFQEKMLEIPFSIEKNETTTISMRIDLYDVLVQENEVYNLIEDGQIHALEQLPLAVGLSENLVKAIE